MIISKTGVNKMITMIITTTIIGICAISHIINDIKIKENFRQRIEQLEKQMREK